LAGALGEMRRAQWLPPEELQTRAEGRLAALLRHAAENVPFYRDFYRDHGLAVDALRTVNDLSQLPILNKAIYRERGMEAFCAENVPAYRRLERATSGSTGEPFRFCLDRAALPVIFASHLFYDSWFGLRPFDRYLRIVFAPLHDPPLPSATPLAVRFRQAVTGRLKAWYEALTQKHIWVWEVNGEKAEEVYRCMEEFRPDFVLGYTSTLSLLADDLSRRGRRLIRPVRGVITIAEPLLPRRRRQIEQYFDAPITNRYGLREFGSWSAQSCSEAPNQFHLNAELVVCEILREDGSRTAPGETGRVVLTDLFNYAMPFIRYDTGDLATADSGRCACGRGFPLIGKLEGRSKECIRTPSGKVISSLLLGDYLWVGGPSFKYNNHLEAVRQYQLVQERPNLARLLIIPADGFNESRRERLREDLARLLGPDMTLVVEMVTEISSEKSGKRSIIKNLCSQPAR
jgi:phenylacetate-CoA ligase